MISASHNMDKCTQCLDCVKNCTGGALSYNEGVFIHSQNNCTLCEVCMDSCDSGAITVKRKCQQE